MDRTGEKISVADLSYSSNDDFWYSASDQSMSINREEMDKREEVEEDLGFRNVDDDFDERNSDDTLEADDDRSILTESDRTQTTLEATEMEENLDETHVLGEGGSDTDSSEKLDQLAGLPMRKTQSQETFIIERQPNVFAISQPVRRPHQPIQIQRKPKTSFCNVVSNFGNPIKPSLNGNLTYSLQNFRELAADSSVELSCFSEGVKHKGLEFKLNAKLNSKEKKLGIFLAVQPISAFWKRRHNTSIGQQELEFQIEMKASVRHTLLPSTNSIHKRMTKKIVLNIPDLAMQTMNPTSFGFKNMTNNKKFDELTSRRCFVDPQGALTLQIEFKIHGLSHQSL